MKNFLPGCHYAIIIIYEITQSCYIVNNVTLMLLSCC